MRAAGEMPEWPNGTDSKSVEQATVPRVQIPISPPLFKDKPLKSLRFRGLFRFRPAKCRRSVENSFRVFLFSEVVRLDLTQADLVT